MINRRKFIGNSALISAGISIYPGRLWSNSRTGALRHLLPAVNHNRMIIKASFTLPLFTPPRIRVGSKIVTATPTDTLGKFWRFDIQALESATTYDLQIEDGKGMLVGDPWPLKTFPDPDAEIETLRLLVYTCAGGNGDMAYPNGLSAFQPIAIRKRLFARALSFNPDIAIGVGDQVYWDQETSLQSQTENVRKLTRDFYSQFGFFDANLPVFGTPNETVLTKVVDAQLADLYGLMFRSTPTYLTQDDHDYFENDEANDTRITFPPTPFKLKLARATQSLYFPEFLPDTNRPAGLPGSSNEGITKGLAESYGTLRYGGLLEALIYDCRRFLTLKGPSAVFVEPTAEAWLKQRTGDEKATRHLVHMPSTPMGWAAGKWGEWYPDILESGGKLGTSKPKPYWQTGWWQQHQRLLGMMAAQTERIPLTVSGDLHAVSAGRIIKSGELDFTDNPIHSVLSGPVSSDDLTWPSAFRNTPPLVPSKLIVEESLSPLENNGFTLLDFDPDKIRVRQFAWHKTRPVEAIDSLNPVNEFTLSR